MWKGVLQEQQNNVLMLKQNVRTLPRLVIRPLLISKETVLEHIGEVRLSSELRDVYQQTDLSPWVWFVEVSTPELYSSGKKIGELILNASYPSAHIMTGLEPLLALRMLDVVIVGSTPTDIHITTDINPSPILSRPSFDHP